MDFEKKLTTRTLRFALVKFSAKLVCVKIKSLISEPKIKKTIKALAREIKADYSRKNPLLIGCLTGSFMFMADLIRKVGIPLQCDFMKLSSYGNKKTSGKIKLLLDNTLDVKGRDVIIIEDIVDTGNSLKFIKKRLLAKKPKSLKTCVLIYKESKRVKIPKKDIDYLGVTIPDVFIIGYGIDYAQGYRELRYVGVVE